MFQHCNFWNATSDSEQTPGYKHQPQRMHHRQKKGGHETSVTLVGPNKTRSSPRVFYSLFNMRLPLAMEWDRYQLNGLVSATTAEDGRPDGRTATLNDAQYYEPQCLPSHHHHPRRCPLDRRCRCYCRCHRPTRTRSHCCDSHLTNRCRCRHCSRHPSQS